jgi:hypothetical protein
MNRQVPNFIFVDIDRCLFRTDKELLMAVEEVCKNIKEILRDKPTVVDDAIRFVSEH